ncbi:Tryptophan synthase beta chain like [Desulfovibrio sp. DV]|nr:Tryptophan synthase beta chain like [Desulfovibrio sp. DV]
MALPHYRRIGPGATESGHDRFAVADAALLAQKARDAATSPRLREMHRFHDSDGDNPHRMVNTLQPGSYVRPHRHLSPAKSESFVLLTGSLGHVVFADNGSFGAGDCVVLSRESGVLAIDVRPGVWHAVFALVPDTTVFEVKPGPYQPLDDKDFAAFAPAEGDDAASAYLQALEERFRELTGLPPRGSRV